MKNTAMTVYKKRQYTLLVTLYSLHTWDFQAMQAQFKANRSHHRTKEWDRVFFKSMKRLEKLQNMYEEYYELVVSISCKINIKYLTNQQMIYWDFPESDGVSVPS